MGYVISSKTRYDVASLSQFALPREVKKAVTAARADCFKLADIQATLQYEGGENKDYGHGKRLVGITYTLVFYDECPFSDQVHIAKVKCRDGFAPSTSKTTIWPHEWTSYIHAAEKAKARHLEAEKEGQAG